MKSRTLVRAVSVAAALAAAALPLVAATQARGAAAERPPGTWCGGTRWKLMTLSDALASKVAWTPAPTSIRAIPALCRIGIHRFGTRAFETAALAGDARDRALPAAVQRRDRARAVRHSLVDVHERISAEPAMPVRPDARPQGDPLRPPCTRPRLQEFAAPTYWWPLGASVRMTGVGYWNPVRTTLGALGNGAELRPVTGLKIINGCGHFG